MQYVTYTLGWVNLYQKFEIEKYTVYGKLIFPKKWKDVKKKIGHTFEDMQSKI